MVDFAEGEKRNFEILQELTSISRMFVLGVVVGAKPEKNNRRSRTWVVGRRHQIAEQSSVEAIWTWICGG